MEFKTEKDFLYHYGYECKRCKYLFKHHCKKNPPLIVLSSRGEMNSFWPTVRDEDWCYSYVWCGSHVEKLRRLDPIIYENGERIK